MLRVVKKNEEREKVKPELVMKYTHTCDIFYFTFMRCMFILLIVNKNEWGREKAQTRIRNLTCITNGTDARYTIFLSWIFTPMPFEKYFLKETKNIFSYLHDIILHDMFSVFIMFLTIWWMHHDKMMSIMFTITFVFQSH